MSQIVLLSDSVIYGELGSVRYIGPYVLASQLEKAGLSTVVFDYFTRKPDFFEYLAKLVDPDTLIIGLSTTFLNPYIEYFQQNRSGEVKTHLTQSANLWCKDDDQMKMWFKDLKDFIRLHCPKAKIVVGGTKALNFCFNPEVGKDVDFFILGAADKSIIDLAIALRENQKIECANLNGLNFINQLTMKNQSEICPQTFYQKNWAIQKNESLPIEVSRGCIFNCKFCYYEKRGSVRKSVDLLLQELTRNYELYGTNVYHFTDDCFNDSREKVESLCNAFLKLPFKLEWVSYARVDVAVKFPETAELMVKSGASALFWGLESFHHEAARRAGKGTPPEKVKEFLLDFMKKFDSTCFSFGSFIVGLPGEPEESLFDTARWLIENRALHSAFFGSLGLAVFNKTFDQTVLDYADYSRFPEKYGFTHISADASYWKHAQMDSIKATHLARQLNSLWIRKKGNGLLSFAWQYPHFRTLGFSKQQLFNEFMDNSKKIDLAKQVAQKHTAFLNQYWESLLIEANAAKMYVSSHEDNLRL